MSHHGENPINEEMQETPAKQMAEAVQQMQISANELKLGATGKFPDGQLVDHDEGEIQITVTHYQGKVVINFGSPVSFIGFTPTQAIDIANLLISHSEAASGKERDDL